MTEKERQSSARQLLFAADVFSRCITYMEKLAADTEERGQKLPQEFQLQMGNIRSAGAFLQQWGKEILQDKLNPVPTFPPRFKEYYTQWKEKKITFKELYTALNLRPGRCMDYMKAYMVLQRQALQIEPAAIERAQRLTDEEPETFSERMGIK